MKKLVFLFFALSPIANAQSETEAIKQSIDAVFKGMMTTDSTIFVKYLHPKLLLKSIIKNNQGETRLAETSRDKFVQSVGTPHASQYEEKLLSYDIKIDGHMAAAWTPYEFYVDGKLLHCGVDVFLLAKLEGIWKIIEIADTRRKDCGQ